MRYFALILGCGSSQVKQAGQLASRAVVNAVIGNRDADELLTRWTRRAVAATLLVSTVPRFRMNEGVRADAEVLYGR
jgi:hypothetical protein